jgi:hypothetical protein
VKDVYGFPWPPPAGNFPSYKFKVMIPKVNHNVSVIRPGYLWIVPGCGAEWLDPNSGRNSIFDVGCLMTTESKTSLSTFSRGRFTTVRLRACISPFPPFSESSIKTVLNHQKIKIFSVKETRLRIKEPDAGVGSLR